VYISVVGADRIPVASDVDRAMFGYFTAKLAGERVMADSGLPVQLPGNAARAFRAGADLAPDRAVGHRRWAAFLAERVSSPSGSTSST
jgi:hypothetical protein